MVQQRENSLKKKKSGVAGMRFKSSKKSSGPTASPAALNNTLLAHKEQEDMGGSSQSATPYERSKKKRLQQSRLAARRGIRISVNPEATSQGVSLMEGSSDSFSSRVDKTATIIAKHLRSLHPSEQRRAALKKRREVRESEKQVGKADRNYDPLVHNATERLNAIKADMELYEKAVSTPLFKEDPLTAIAQHLDATLDILQPLTPDVGRLPR